MGSLRVGHDWATSLSLFTFMHWRRKWQPTPVFLAGESQGQGSLVGCCLWGRTVGHDWSDLAAAAAAAIFHCWRRKQQLSVFLPGKSHGERSHGVTRVRHDLAIKPPPTTNVPLYMCMYTVCIYIHTVHLLYPFICLWTLRLFPCLGYCE